MRILHVVPPWIAVPPTLYGGIERFVYAFLRAYRQLYQDDELFLFSVGTSVPPDDVHLKYVFPEELQSFSYDRVAEIVQLSAALNFARQENIDLVHIYSLERALLLIQESEPFEVVWSVECVPTNLANYILPRISNRIHVCFQTQSHRKQFPYALQNVHVIPNGIDTSAFPFFDVEQRQDYLSFVGKLIEEKGIMNAIDISLQTEMPLTIGGMIRHQAYFKDKVLPRIEAHSHLIQYVGEVTDAQRNELIGRSKYFLFPIQWEEPFGQVLIEAGAVGTPVLALNRGAVGEVLTKGVTGFIFDDISGIIDDITQNYEVSPQACRNMTVQRFDADVIAGLYRVVYEKALQHK